jgi:acetyl-CoA C-acetyltransferase
MESMTNAPHLLEKSREGYKYGDVKMRDHMDYDALHDVFTDQGMGNLTESANHGERVDPRGAGRVRRTQPPELAAKAWKDGCSTTRSSPVEIPQRKGDPIEFKPPTRASAPTPPPSRWRAAPGLRQGRHHHRRLASQISDGAAAVVVMSKAKAEELGLTWLAEIGAHGVVAGPDSTLQSQPAKAIKAACAKEGIAPTDLDLRRDQRGLRRGRSGLAKELGVDADKVNPNGGAIAMGHPLGMSGARIVLHLARAQAPRWRRRRGGPVRRRRSGRRPHRPRAPKA